MNIDKNNLFYKNTDPQTQGVTKPIWHGTSFKP